MTKCGGTSLISSVRRILNAENLLFCSSFINEVKSNRPFYWEIVNLSSIKCVYGHFLHESMFLRSCYEQSTDNSNIFLPSFTVIREPVSRVLSHLRHITRITAQTYDSLEYINNSKSTICKEIVRCFPSVQEVYPKKELYEQAAIASNLLNTVFSLDNLGAFAKYFEENLNTSFPVDITNVRENVSIQKIDDFDALITKASKILIDSADFKLYNHMSRSHKSDFATESNDLKSYILEKYKSKRLADYKEIVFNFQSKYCINEFKLNHKYSTDLLKDFCEEKIKYSQRLMNAI